MWRGRRPSTDIVVSAVVALIFAEGGPALAQRLAPPRQPPTPPPRLLEPLFALSSGSEPSQAIRLVWRNRPQIRIGDHIRIDLRARLQNDWRTFDPDIDVDTYALNAMRFSVAGEIEERRRVPGRVRHAERPLPVA